ncbi:heterokaryon incompatibility protein-domain-containing protein [Sordaria brevicollis]|uniref:Heterokaryon incompatibility protein-domain-containing protein n=1 Tax=Sordaria brevicollis TaxID=83679 RepID=A0AAE0UDB9_SORBR|nr:heterokaryon incompatibility protein-domain-containing protein [Sordaria brevicollis]
MSRSCLVVDDEPHTCAFCEEHLALDFSTVNGAISPTRLEQMQKRLIQVGFLGPNENLNDEKFSDFREILKEYHIYDVNLNLFWSQTADACRIAEMVRKFMKKGLEDDEHHLLKVRISSHFKACDESIIMQIDHVKIEPNTRFEWFVDPIVSSESTVLAKNITTDEGTAAARQFPCRPMNHEPLRHTLEQARNWLGSCFRDHWHPESSNAPKYTPKRLLEISRSLHGSPCVTIVEASTPVTYAALSYKWGGIHEPRLTRSRIYGATASGLKLSLEALPQTIADAVKVAEALGINHLWVDALCIIQDDDADKAREIGQMAHIYRHATITILASRANSASEGFLHCRHGKVCHENAGGSSLSRWDFRLPFRTSSNEQSSIILTERGNVFVDDEPLVTRAWAFQEALLSPHIISYGRVRTVFHCSHAEQWQAYWYMFSDNGNLRPVRDITRLRQHFRKILSRPYTGSNQKHDEQPEDYETDRSRIMEDWYTLLHLYTERELTNPRDRLNAVAALAEVFAQRLEDEYVAGFWRSDPLRALLWMQVRRSGWDIPKRPINFCGPTWSWASMAGEVYFLEATSLRRDRDLRILDWHVQLGNDANKFGAVDSGFLKIRAKVAHCTITSRGERPYYSVSVNWPTQHREGSMQWENLRHEYYPDALEQEFMQENSTMTVLLLILGFYPRSGGRRSCRCLVLKNASRGLYSRLGFLIATDLSDEGPSRPKYDMCIYDDNWDQAFPVETITIV